MSSGVSVIPAQMTLVPLFRPGGNVPVPFN